MTSPRKSELQELLKTSTAILKEVHAQNRKYRAALREISARVCETERERQMREVAAKALVEE